MNVILILTTAIRLWPYILQGIRAAESAFPLPKAGRDKLDAVLSAVEVVFDMGAEFQSLPKDQVLNIASKLANKAVASANASGEFKPVAAPAK